jgi:hypothetical protein
VSVHRYKRCVAEESLAVCGSNVECSCGVDNLEGADDSCDAALVVVRERPPLSNIS